MRRLPPSVRNALLPTAVALAVIIIFKYGSRSTREVIQSGPTEDDRPPEAVASPSRRANYASAIESVEKLLQTQKLDANQEAALKRMVVELSTEKYEKEMAEKSNRRPTGN